MTQGQRKKIFHNEAQNCQRLASVDPSINTDKKGNQGMFTDIIA